jgi:hypothetical protein
MRLSILLEILKRLFIKLPLFILWAIFLCTIIVPIIYWILTGKDYANLSSYI